MDNIGDFDESDPNGRGYLIMAPEGLRVFDKEDREEYLAEKRRVEEWLKRHQSIC